MLLSMKSLACQTAEDHPDLRVVVEMLAYGALAEDVATRLGNTQASAVSNATAGA
jgi:hypothetical protein